MRSFWVAVGLSWLGFYVHNVADLPDERPVGPATLSITVVYVLLVALWFSPVRGAATWVLRGWGLLHLVGGGVLSVLPLPFLPFDPPQTLYHYSFHVLYVLTQVPLVLLHTRLVSGRAASSAKRSTRSGVTSTNGELPR